MENGRVKRNGDYGMLMIEGITHALLFTPNSKKMLFGMIGGADKRTAFNKTEAHG
jgi:hypothetical protein